MSTVSGQQEEEGGPWWGSVDPDYLILGTGGDDASSTFAEFGRKLSTSLEADGNSAPLLMPVSSIPSIESLPDDVLGVVTNDEEVAAWARLRHIPLVTWREVPTKGFRISVDGRSELGESFQSTGMVDGARRVRDILSFLAANSSGQGSDQNTGFGVSAVEHRRLEVVISAAFEVVARHSLDPDDRALLETAIETMQLQLRTSKPDRVILGRALNRVAGFTGGLLTGVAANYMFNLLPHFHA